MDSGKTSNLELIKNNELRNSIINLAKAGHTYSEICEKLNCKYNTVWHVCQQNGIKVTRTSSNLIKIISELINADKSLMQIGKDYGVTYQRIQQIYNACLANGIPVVKRKKGRRCQESNQAQQD